MVKVKFLILLLLSMLLFTSCGLKFSLALDEEKHNLVQYVEEKDGASQYLIYNNNRYMYGSTLDFFRVTKKEADASYPYSFEYEDDVLLGWNGHRYFGYQFFYYSYTTDNPLFIYNRHKVYFREDYNYLEDVFEIANTSDEIVWQDMFGPEQSKIDFVNPTNVIVSSKLCPRIKTYLALECVDNQWYMSLPHFPFSVYTPSDEFLKILFDNGIISSNDTQKDDGATFFDWKTAYLDFIERRESEYGRESDYGFDFRYALVYIDHDDIPELYAMGAFEADGDLICSYKNGRIIEERLARMYGGKYVERSGIFINQNGHMGRYYDNVYKLDETGFSQILNASYTERYEPFGDGEDDYEIINEYFIDGNPVTKEEYTAAVNASIDLSQTVKFYENPVPCDIIKQQIADCK